MRLQVGEGKPSGPGPSQGEIQTRGNEYLEKEYPLLSYIKSARYRIIRTLKCIIRTLNCIIRTLKCIIRTLKCIIRTLNRIIRTLNCIIRTLNVRQRVPKPITEYPLLSYIMSAHYRRCPRWTPPSEARPCSGGALARLAVPQSGCTVPPPLRHAAPCCPFFCRNTATRQDNHIPKAPPITYVHCDLTVRAPLHRAHDRPRGRCIACNRCIVSVANAARVMKRLQHYQAVGAAEADPSVRPSARGRDFREGESVQGVGGREGV